MPWHTQQGWLYGEDSGAGLSCVSECLNKEDGSATPRLHLQYVQSLVVSALYEVSLASAINTISIKKEKFFIQITLGLPELRIRVSGQTGTSNFSAIKQYLSVIVIRLFLHSLVLPHGWEHDYEQFLSFSHQKVLIFSVP